jgi:hypothetical protein
MNTEQLNAYVRATLALHGYQFDDEKIAAITAQFARIEKMAGTFLDIDLPLEADAAPVFVP